MKYPTSPLQKIPFQVLGTAFGSVFGKLRPECAFSLDVGVIAPKLIKLMPPKLTQKLKPLLSSKENLGFIIHGLTFGRSKAQLSFLILVLGADTIKSATLQGFLLPTASLESDDDDELPVTKECTSHLCITRGDESLCEEWSIVVPLELYCPPANDGCPNTPCSADSGSGGSGGGGFGGLDMDQLIN